jgi:xylulose-5-phosphate/fructose-6-phosphate phosphoketolase
LFGHWGSDPGQSFTLVHLDRAIVQRELNVIFISGPGHGAPATLAHSYLEGRYSEVYPDRAENEEGMERLFRMFSFPGGIGSHCTPETPGSIHEGGELGYSLSHAYGAAFDNPDLIVAAMIGDGEVETGPLATSWHSNKFLNPARDGAVLPILHLNGYKIANPTILARIPHEELEALLTGYGHKPYFVEGDDPQTMHQKMAATLDSCLDEIHAIQARARTQGDLTRPRWPMIVLRTPKGWTGPKEVGGHRVEGSWRHIRCRWRTPIPIRRASSWSSRGCAVMSRNSCSTNRAGCVKNCARCHRRATAASARIRTRMAGRCARRSICPHSRTMPSM